MSIRHRQSLRLKPAVSPQVVLANELLQFSSLELEQAIARELAENPALELTEVTNCPRCGSEIQDGLCAACGPARGSLEAEREDWRDAAVADDYNAWPYPPGEDWDDPVSRLASRITLKDHVLHQARMGLGSDDALVAAHLVQSLDDRGFLRCDLDEVAAAAGVEQSDVERVLAGVQALDPVGVGARDARECLLLQIAHLQEEGVAHPLAKCLVEEHWELLGRCSPSRVADAVRVPVEQVCEAISFIRENLSPYPAHLYWSDERDPPPQGTTGWPEPDVIIRESKTVRGEYDIELPKAGVRRLRVGPTPSGGLSRNHVGDLPRDERAWQQWNDFRSRARLFVRSIEQRWDTLYELAVCLIDCQREFLGKGEMHLRPLTRARVADMMDVHESTVSRAVAGKYVQLPRGDLVPMDKFFDSAAPIKRVIEDLVEHESEPLSDGVIADKLAERGYQVARRTVAKYRNALGILPCSLRRRGHDVAPQ